MYYHIGFGSEHANLTTMWTDQRSPRKKRRARRRWLANDHVAYAGPATPHSTCPIAKALVRSSSWLVVPVTSSKILVFHLATTNRLRAILIICRTSFQTLVPGHLPLQLLCLPKPRDVTHTDHLSSAKRFIGCCFIDCTSPPDQKQPAYILNSSFKLDLSSNLGSLYLLQAPRP